VDWTQVDTFVPVIEALDSWNIPGRVMIACAPSNASVVYAILSGAQVTPGDEFIRSQGVMIIKSIDGGKNWLKVNMPGPSPYTRSQWSFLAWHALTAAVQPDDPDVLWVGGLDLYRSDNGGWSYEQKSLWWNFGVWYEEEFPPYVHADQHNLKYRPGSSDELLSSNDGGVFLAADSKATAPGFVEKSNGYNTLQYYTCAIHPEAGKRYFLGGCQDNGTFRSGDEPTSKKVSVSYGDGTYCFIDENEPNIQISGSQFNTLYYSRDGEHNETRSYNFPGGTFVNPMDYDADDNIIYANGMSWDGSFRDYLFIIRLANDTLLQLIPVPAGTGSSVPFSAIHRMPWKQKGNPVILAGSESGRLFRITLQVLPEDQYFATASELGGGQLPAGYISCVQSGRSSQQILLTYSSYGVKHVWETTDGGSTWKDKTGNLPDMPVRWAIYLPGTDNGVMLATEHGIWYTLDISEENITWVRAGGVFPNVRVDMLRSRKSDGYVLAATHGRGLFISPAPLQLNDKPSVSPEGMLSLYPNPASDYIVLKIKGMDPGVVRLEIYDAAGRLQGARSLDFDAGKTRRVPVAELPAGSYILRLGNEKWNISHTFIKKE
jgi:hypothetical protein